MLFHTESRVLNSVFYEIWKKTTFFSSLRQIHPLALVYIYSDNVMDVTKVIVWKT